MIFHYYRIGMPSWFLMLTVAPVIVMIFAIIITIWWKISAHMFGIGSLVGGVMGVSYFVEKTNSSFLIMILFILSGFVGTSRLILRRHTPGQVYAGFLLGFGVTFACIGIGA
jgi:membrane-associated phospholipid phosphatase